MQLMSKIMNTSFVFDDWFPHIECFYKDMEEDVNDVIQSHDYLKALIENRVFEIN